MAVNVVTLKVDMYSDELAGQFEAGMLACGWESILDEAGTRRLWEHSETGRVVLERVAYEYWYCSGRTPVAD